MSDLLIKLAENPILTTERVILRPIKLTDAKDMFEYASDLETTRYVFAKHHSIKETQDIIAKDFLFAPLGKFAIELKSTHKMIGTISYNRMNEELKVAEIGYTLNKDFWSKGFMTEILATLITYGFEVFGFNKLLAVFDETNIASSKVIQKCGMKFIGKSPYSRFDFVDRQKIVTDVFYRLTKEEYFDKNETIFK